MSVLISCIGGSDPIRSGHDGPLLHILRHHESIDKCYLLMSTKACEIHYDENRNYYKRCFGDFCENNNREITFIYKDLGVDKANDFDIYFDLFFPIFKMVVEENPDDLIYVNLTSGTPQMQTSLALLANQFVENNICSIQVDNFEYDSKNKSHDSLSDKYDYDFEVLYSNDYKEIDIAINRCKTVKLTTIAKNNIIEQIKSLIKLYNYNAILEVSKQYLSSNSSLSQFLFFLKYRQEMDYVKAANILQSNKWKINDYLPAYSKNMNKVNKRKNELFEYYLIIKNLFKNQQYNDAILRFDVLLIELFIEFLLLEFSFDINRYKKNKKFDIIELEQDDPILSKFIVEKFKEYYNIDYRNNFINIPLVQILFEYYGNDKYPNISSFLIKCKELHDHRNDAAHCLSVTTKNDITDIISLELIDKMISNVFMIIYPDICENDFNSYDIANEKILSLIK